MIPRASILVIGKRGGILQWFEHMLAAATFLPEVRIDAFALNHGTWTDRVQNRALKLTGQKQKIDPLIARRLHAKIDACRPDLIIILDLFCFSAPMLEALEKAKPKAKIVQWIGDFLNNGLKSNINVVDHFFFTDSSFIQDAKLLGISAAHYLPLAANPAIFNEPDSLRRRNNRLLFIGAHSENRETFINSIHTPKTLIGKGWKNAGHSGDERLNKNIPILQVARLYQEHSTVLNVLNKKNVRHGLNMRCFEATACGAILLTEDSPDNERCFAVGEEILTYRQPEDVVRHMADLAADPERRQMIAKRGQERTLAEHCYHHRIMQLLNQL